MKVGDKVTLGDLSKFDEDDAPGVVKEMLIWSGEEVIIGEMDGTDFFYIEDDIEYWLFSKNWIV